MTRYRGTRGYQVEVPLFPVARRLSGLRGLDDVIPLNLLTQRSTLTHLVNEIKKI